MMISKHIKSVQTIRTAAVLLAISGVLATRSHGASVNLGTATPSVGDGVQNLTFSANAASNTQIPYVPSNYVGNRTDGLTIGESFTTGSNPGGYSLTSISVRQVSWGPTSWDYTGGNVTLRIFNLTGGSAPVWNSTQLLSETAAVGGAAGGVTTGGTPSTPQWLTFTLSSPLSLDPNTLYGFAIGSDGTSSNDGFLMELDGTSTNSYANGFALSVDNSSSLWDGNNGEPSDRAFVAAMTAQSATSVAEGNISIQRVGSNVELTWTSGTLLEATNVNGPWFTNLNTSPYQFAPTGTQKFYRLLMNTGFYTWPAYNPDVAYDYVDEFGIMNLPGEVLPDGTTGVLGIYTNQWWSFVYGTNKNSLVTSAAWVPMVQRFNTDFSYIADVLRWPHDRRVQNGYYSAIYLFGSGLSTDSASNTDLGGWQSATSYRGQVWPMALLSYYPVYSFDPACPYSDAVAQQGAAVHEGIHCVLASMPGCYNSAWTGEAGNTWLQGTMESQRSGDFSGMGWLSAAAAVAQFMPIECYSGWLQDGSFGGPSAEGVYQTDTNGTVLCTWRNLLGGTQYGECFMYCMDAILGYQSVAWVYAHCNLSGRLLQDLAQHPQGLGASQTRRLIQEFRGRAAMCDFARKSYAYQQLLNNVWNTAIQQEYSPYWMAVPVWNATCYVVTTNVGGTLTPENRTLPGWSGANQIPLTVSGSTASVTFNPQGANMSCQLVYRDTSGKVRYSYPVASGVCSIPLQNVLNNVVIAVICNTDYIYQGEYSRTNKFHFTLTLGTGVTGTANIYTKWFNYNPATYAVTAVATGPGIISPAGTNTVAAGANKTFTITPNPGYDILQVLAGGVPVGAVTNYTFSNVRGNVSIEAQFGLKTYRIFAKSSPAGSITPAGFTTLSPGASQSYSVSPNSGWAVYSLKVDGADQGPLTSYTFNNVQTDHNIKASYYGNNPSVPQPANLLFALSTDTLETNGIINTWDAYAPGGFAAYGTASPAVELVNGAKWEKNLYNDGDGFGITTTTTPIPCVGASIVVAVKPTRNGISQPWTSIVDCFYNNLVLGMRNNTGELIVIRNGTQFNTGVIIPDGQRTVLSLVVQSSGTFIVYANGSQVYSSAALSTFTQIAPGSQWYMHDITVGRNGPDTWTTFNGNIGDVYVYTTALSSTDRQQVESFIRGKFGF